MCCTMFCSSYQGVTVVVTRLSGLGLAAAMLQQQCGGVANQRDFDISFFIRGLAGSALVGLLGCAAGFTVASGLFVFTHILCHHMDCQLVSFTDTELHRHRHNCQRATALAAPFSFHSSAYHMLCMILVVALQQVKKSAQHSWHLCGVTRGGVLPGSLGLVYLYVLGVS